MDPDLTDLGPKTAFAPGLNCREFEIGVQPVLSSIIRQSQVLWRWAADCLVRDRRAKSRELHSLFWNWNVNPFMTMLKLRLIGAYLRIWANLLSSFVRQSELTKIYGTNGSMRHRSSMFLLPWYPPTLLTKEYLRDSTADCEQDTDFRSETPSASKIREIYLPCITISRVPVSL